MSDRDSRPAEPTEQPEDENDTEGHSLLMAELGRTIVHDRAKEAAQAARESRMREDAKPKSGRSLFRR